MEQYTPRSEYKYSPVWRRLVGGSLDALPLCIFLILNAKPSNERLVGAIRGLPAVPLQPSEILFPFVALFYCLYLSLADGTAFQSTLGKRALRLLVVRPDTPARIGLKLSLCRWIVGFFLPFLALLASASYALYGSGLPFMLVLGLLFLTWTHAALTMQKTTFYDVIFNTRVVLIY
jgi:hypothetical protein